MLMYCVVVHCEEGRVIDRIVDRQTFRFLQEAFSLPTPFCTLAGYLSFRIELSQLNYRMGAKIVDDQSGTRG